MFFAILTSKYYKYMNMHFILHWSLNGNCTRNRNRIFYAALWRDCSLAFAVNIQTTNGSEISMKHVCPFKYYTICLKIPCPHAVLIDRLIQDFYFGQRLTTGPTDISSFDVTSFVVSRFWRNRGRRTSPIDVSTPKSTMFCPKGKKKRY
jgi:hypothetical protein